MTRLPKATRWLLAAAYLVLLIAIGLQRLDGELTGNWTTVLFSLSLFTLAFIWEGLARFAKK